MFAQKKEGDGLCIVALNQVLMAPCDGATFIHHAHRAVTITEAEGDMRLFVGLSTDLYVAEMRAALTGYLSRRFIRQDNPQGCADEWTNLSVLG